MRITFFLPTEEEWYGTYEGGYVEVYVSNEKQPFAGGWRHEIIINFSGNDDLMWRKIYAIEENDKDKELMDALNMISKIPLPVTKEYLKTIGFEPD